MVDHNIFDSLLELRDVATAAEVADANDAAVSMEGITPFHHDNVDMHYSFKVVFYGIVLAGTAIATQIDLVVDVDTLEAMGSAIEVARVIETDTANAATSYEVVVHTNTIEKLESGADWIRTGIEVTGGTSPTVVYGSFVTRLT